MKKTSLLDKIYVKIKDWEEQIKKLTWADRKRIIYDFSGKCCVSIVVIAILHGCFFSQLFTSGKPFVISLCLEMVLVPILAFLLYKFGKKTSKIHNSDEALRNTGVENTTAYDSSSENQQSKQIKKEYLISEFFPISQLDWLVISFKKEPISYKICFEHREADNRVPVTLDAKYDKTITVIIPPEWFFLSWEKFIGNLEKLTNEEAKKIEPIFGEPYEKYKYIDIHNLPELKEFFGFF